MNRRHFLEFSAKGMAFLALSELLTIENALAQSSREEFIVQINLPGGWDITLGIDPWLKEKPDEKDLFIEYDLSAVQKKDNIYFGPAMSVMAPFSSQMAVINGIFLSAADNGHQAAEQYMMSGSVNQAWGSIAVEIGECEEEKFLGLLSGGLNALGSRSTKLTPVVSLKNLSSNTKSDSFQSSTSKRGRLESVAGDLSSQLQKIKAFEDTNTRLKQQGLNLTDHHYMASAFTTGLSKTASYQAMGSFLDTHSNHVGTHLSSQTTLWTDVANLLQAFKAVPYGDGGESVFDRTTFVITSEFSRTAALNNSGGKDHNPLANSVMIISPHVKGTTVGGTHLITRNQSKSGSSYHISSPIDFKTGLALPSKQNAFIIRPENITATVVDLLGVSRKRFASVNPKVPGLAHLIRK